MIYLKKEVIIMEQNKNNTNINWVMELYKNTSKNVNMHCL